MANPLDRLGDILIDLNYIEREALESFFYKGHMENITSGVQNTSIQNLLSGDRRIYHSGDNSNLLGTQLLASNLITNEQLEKALLIKKNLGSNKPTVSSNKLILIAEILYKISRSDNIYSVLNLIMEYCSKVICTEASTLFLYNKERNTLSFDVVTGREKGLLMQKEMPVGEGIAGWVFQNNKSSIVRDVLNDERFNDSFDKLADFKTKSILCVPLRVNNKPEGVLEVINKIGNNPFDKDDESLLQILANQVGLHIENRILLEYLHNKADQLEKEKDKYQNMFLQKETLLNQLKQTYEDLKTNQKELEKVNNELEDFVYIISHDLKEPLFSIEGYTKKLSMSYNDKLDEKGKSYISRTRVNIELMAKKLYEIMEILKVGRVRYVFSNNDSSNIVDDILKYLEDRITTNKIDGIVQDNLPRIFCDEKRLKDVFLNLIVNAIKFIGNDIQRQVRIGCEMEENCYKFFVEDTGIGIRAEYQDQIFKTFTRLNDIYTEGTGVGLSMVKKIVELHKGAIWVESPVKDGKGSRFCFTISKSLKDETLLPS